MIKWKVRVAVVGCGQISEAHVKEIGLLKDAEIVAVCDILESLARDLAERYEIPEVFEDADELLEKAKPDVVHVTTPPHTHLGIGSMVMQSGCHAYIEKPFGLNCEEAEKLVHSAQKNRVLICAGFSQVYDTVSIKMRKFIEDGRLGDVVHVESYYGNSLAGNFSRIFLNDKNHWIHKLPGKLFQNIISHALYHITPYLPNNCDVVKCLAIDRSENGVFFDELRVMLLAGNVTAYITFTSSVNPITQFVRIYGTKAIAEMDLANHAFRCYQSTNLPGPVARVYNSLSTGAQSIKEGIRHAKQMWRGEDRFFAGMGNLFSAFYDSIREGGLTPPVAYDEVLKVSTIIDEISRQCSQLETQDGGRNFN
jgi:predicted dehydrogenase